MTTSFNLTSESWLTVFGGQKISLLDAFSDPSIKWLSGNAIEKMAAFRLLLAIAQAAYTPKDEEDCDQYSTAEMSKNVADYLNEHSDKFDLFGERPFLQIPQIADVRDKLTEKDKADFTLVSGLDAEKAYKTKRVVFSSNVAVELPVERLAQLLLVQQAFGKAGKSVNKTIQLSKEFGIKKSAKPGTGLATQGLLHSHLVAENLLETIRLNLMTEQAIQETGLFPRGVGIPPWERMPVHQECDVARDLMDSYQGRLIPMGRFCLFIDDGVMVIEGIQHANYLDGRRDLTVSADLSSKKPKVLWSRTNKKPWRELTAILSFMTAKSGSNFDNTQIKLTLPRARKRGGVIGVWSGGQQISYNSGEQYMTGTDDYVDSTTWLDAAALGEPWFVQIEQETSVLDSISKILYGAVNGYLKSNGIENTGVAGKASHTYWEMVEPLFSEMIELAGDEDSGDKLLKKRQQATRIATDAYNKACPSSTARQIQGWAENRPKFQKLLEAHS